MKLRSDQLQNTMRILAADRQFTDAMLSGDRDTVTQALTHSGERAGADLAVVLDDQGRVLAGTAGTAPLPRLLPEVVRRAAEQGATRATVNGERRYRLRDGDRAAATRSWAPP